MTSTADHRLPSPSLPARERMLPRARGVTEARARGLTFAAAGEVGGWVDVLPDVAVLYSKEI